MFGTGRMGFAIITAVLALLTYGIVFALLRFDQQFYKGIKKRFLRYLNWRPWSKHSQESNRIGTMLTKNDPGRLEARRTPRWKVEHSEQV